MAWGPSRWLVVSRSVQFLCAVAGTSLNGFVTASLYSKDSNMPLTLLTLELLICPILIYTVIAMVLQHTGKRVDRRGWLLTFIITDIVFLCVNLAIVCILARSGLPQTCRGLLTFRPGTDQPREPFTTLGFSDGGRDQRGELDQFCNHERANFIVSIFLVFTFQATTIFASLAYYKNKHAYDSKLHDGTCEDNQSLNTLRSRPSSPAPNPTPSNHRISFANTIAPGSEGILTRNTSIRSTVTTSTMASAGTNPRASLLAARRGQGHAIPRRPIGHSPPPPLPTGRSPGGGGGHAFLPLSVSEIDSDDDDDRAMPVPDGMQYRLADNVTPTQHHRPPPPPPPSATNPPHPKPTPGPSASEPTPLLLATQEISGDDAHHALVSDGMRPSGPGLPPYEPPPSGPSTFHTISLDDEPKTATAPPRQPPPPPPRRNSHSRSKGSMSSGGVGVGGGMPLLLEEDEVAGDDAHHALVSDGMRPAGPGLPPYRPADGEGGAGDVKGR
ncbi:hypothetical protein QBC39DRAFT_329969 [Podospora conica]|nr:hypothetical protein QBC39DRAFT_329969 [Schizothecium conicum]